MEMRNLQDCDVVSAFISKDAFMKALADESGTNKDFPEKITEWIATGERFS